MDSNIQAFISHITVIVIRADMNDPTHPRKTSTYRTDFFSPSSTGRTAGRRFDPIAPLPVLVHQAHEPSPAAAMTTTLERASVPSMSVGS